MTDEKPEAQKPRSKRLYVMWSVALALGGLGIAALCIVVLARPMINTVRGQVGAQLKRLHGACEIFRIENNRYPWTETKDVDGETVIKTRQVYAELTAGAEARVNKTRNYLGPVRKKYIKDGTLVDGWGNEVQIRMNPATGTPVIWSHGPDGKDDTNDGESPDPAKQPKTYHWFGKGDFGDDIVVGVERR